MPFRPPRSLLEDVSGLFWRLALGKILAEVGGTISIRFELHTQGIVLSDCIHGEPAAVAQGSGADHKVSTSASNVAPSKSSRQPIMPKLGVDRVEYVNVGISVVEGLWGEGEGQVVVNHNLEGLEEKVLLAVHICIKDDDELLVADLGPVCKPLIVLWD